jgi:hypothetical protein
MRTSLSIQFRLQRTTASSLKNYRVVPEMLENCEGVSPNPVLLPSPFLTNLSPSSEKFIMQDMTL